MKSRVINSQERKELLNQITDTTNIINGSIEEGGEIFSTLLTMDNEDFKILYPTFLEEIKKTFNESGTQLLLSSMMNLQGVKYEDISSRFQEAIDSVDLESNEDMLSPEKKTFLKEFLSIIINSIEETQQVTKRIIQIPIELIDENAKIPSYANVSDAGADLYALEDYVIKPGEQVMIKTGIKIALPYGYAVLIQPRSGLSSKSKLRICNTPGLIDSGYRGEICVLMENVDSPIRDITQDEEGKIEVEYGRTYTIEAGDRIAQMRLVEVPTMAFSQVSNIGEYESERGEGGFGSTGD